MTKHWDTIRVFISSTFRDMHAERDYLVKVVFPKLRERLEPYQLHLEDIDLRWGVTEEQSDNDMALELCLQKIDECRPYFVGILGERYGWVPKSFPKATASIYGWIQHTSGKSLTELEILHGVLNKPEMQQHALFCFRDNAFAADVPDWMRSEIMPEGEYSAQKLADLKERIARSVEGSALLRDYPCQFAGLRVNPRNLRLEVTENDRAIIEGMITNGYVDLNKYEDLDQQLKAIVARNAMVYLKDLHTFGDWIYDQLWAKISAERGLPDTAPVDRLEKDDPLAYEAQFHDRFIESRTRTYVPRLNARELLHRHINSDSAELCLVTGPSGSGKSAILADLAQELSTQNELLLIPHFVGTSPGSTSLRNMLRRFCEILKSEFAYTEDIPYEINPLIERFRKFVADVPKDRKVAIIIDALNQLDKTDAAHNMSWLPGSVPAQVKIVCSCIDDADSPNDVLEAFKRRPCQRIPVEPLDDNERKQIIRDIPSLSAKTLDEKQVELLLSNEATRNPLFLLVALEELRGFGSFAHVNTRISQFPEAGSNAIPEIFAQVIERLQEDFNSTIVEKVLCYLASARKGMTEKELVELIEGIGAKESTSDLFPILRQLRSYLQRRGEAIDFFHRGLYKAVKSEWLIDTDNARSTHAELARYFRTKADPSSDLNWTGKYLRGISELPYHLTQAELWDDLETVLTSLNFIQEKCAAKLTYELVDDYNLALESLPEAKPEIAEKRKHEARVQKYIADLIAYAKGEISTLDIIPAAKLRTDEELEQERQRIFNNPTRLDRIKDFIIFMGREAWNLHYYASDIPNFAIQQAWNYADKGPVCEAAERMQFEGFSCLLLRAPLQRPPWNPIPQVSRILHGNWVQQCLSITPDGRKAISCSQGRTCAVWDLQTGQKLRTFIGHKGWLNAVSITPDGRIAISGCDNACIIWEIDSGQPLNTLPGWTLAVSITPDAKKAIIGTTHGTCIVWDIDGRQIQRTLSGHVGWVNAVKITPDGKRAISCSHDKMCIFWDLESGLALKTLVGHTKLVRDVDITPDGKRAISGSNDNTFILWDLESGQALKTLSGSSGIFPRSVSITPDGKRAISTFTERSCAIWDLESGSLLKTLVGHSHMVTHVHISPDGQRAISSSTDSYCFLWNLDCEQAAISSEMHAGSISSIRVRPGGIHAVSGSYDKRCIVWDLINGQPLQVLEGHNSSVSSIEFTHDGKTMISRSVDDNTSIVWNIDSGQAIKTLEGPSHDAAFGRNYCVCVTPDGKRIASGYNNDSFILWDIDRMQHRYSIVRNSLSMNCTPDGKWAISVTNDGALLLSDIENNEAIKTLKGSHNTIREITIPDGFMSISLSQDDCTLWDFARGHCILAFAKHTSRIETASITPDGKKMVTGSFRDCIVWDLENGRKLKTLTGHTSWIHALSITPDGKRLITGSSDSSCIVWDLERGQKIAHFTIGSTICAVSFFPGGIVGGTYSGEIFILHACRELLCPSTPIVTARRIWDFDLHEYQPLSADCPLCGHRFPPPQALADIVKAIHLNCHIGPEDSPCLKLPNEAWDDPKLLSKCPNCGEAIKFNPFFPVLH